MSKLATLLMGSVGEGPVPTEPGTPWGGGFYAGMIRVSEQVYALVVSPKGGGESPITLRCKTTNTSTSGTTSSNDGWSNTNAMIQSSVDHPAAEFCEGLSINGYDDWYLPSFQELDILYRAFKPSSASNNTGGYANPNSVPPEGGYTSSNPAQTSVDLFKSGGEESFETNIYWSSRQGFFDSSSNWSVSFGDGRQREITKTSLLRVRAIRRVPIPEPEEKAGSESYGVGTHTFTVPPEITEITVDLRAGGGGGGSAGPNAYNGSIGSSSYLQIAGVTLLSVSGGSGGTAGNPSPQPSSGAAGQGGASAGGGGYGGGGGSHRVLRTVGHNGSNATEYGSGGGGAGGGGSPGSGNFGSDGSPSTSASGGAGGKGAYIGGLEWGYGGGGGGGRGGSVSNRKIEVTPGQEITVSVGQGGRGGDDGQYNMPGRGADGGSGSCTISWYQIIR